MPKRFSKLKASFCVAQPSWLQSALPSDRGTLEVSGTNLMYEGARVKSWILGRDVNPAGRGDGAYYAQGAFAIGSVRPSPTTTPVGGWGNSVNNELSQPRKPWDGWWSKHEACRRAYENAKKCCLLPELEGAICNEEEWYKYYHGFEGAKDCCNGLLAQKASVDRCTEGCLDIDYIDECFHDMCRDYSEDCEDALSLLRSLFDWFRKIGCNVPRDPSAYSICAHGPDYDASGLRECCISKCKEVEKMPAIPGLPTFWWKIPMGGGCILFCASMALSVQVAWFRAHFACCLESDN